jgi:AraC-like DNA-binding protein
VVTYYNQGQVYRRDTASAEGDRCEWFAFAPRLLLPALRELDPGAEDRPGAPFPFDHGPSDARSYLLQRRVVRALEHGPDTDPLWVEESMLRVLSRVLAQKLGADRGSAPKESAARRRDRAEAAKRLLATRLADRICLDQIAEGVGCSVFHLCRLFRRETGFTLHGYRQHLRLRRALERVGAAERDLSRLALELGFSSHSHFTAAFRRVFGMTPSSFRARR